MSYESYFYTPTRTKRKLPTAQEIIGKAAEEPCSFPTNCGDGRNGYDCASCMARAVIKHKRRREKKGVPQNHGNNT